MPPAFGWLVFFLGIAAVAACFLLPRDIGKEDEPVLGMQIKVPPIRDKIEDLRFAAWQRQTRNGARTRLSPAAEPRMPRAIRDEPVSAMGAPQPTIAQDQPASYVLPTNDETAG